MVFLTSVSRVSDRVFITSGERYFTYLIRGNGDLAIVDANYADAMPGIISNMKSFGFVPSEINWIFVTEYHEDHVGGLPEMLKHSLTAKIATSSFNAKALEDPSWRFRELSGISDQKEVIERYGRDALIPLKVNSVLMNGDRIKVGDMTFDVIIAPGHSPEEFCLYESSQRLLVCSDSFGIFSPESRTTIPLPFHELSDYKRSMKRLSMIESETLLTGHNGVVKGDDLEMFVQSGLEAADEWEDYIMGELSRIVTISELSERVFRRFPACKAWDFELVQAVVESYLESMERADIAKKTGTNSWGRV